MWEAPETRVIMKLRVETQKIYSRGQKINTFRPHLEGSTSTLRDPLGVPPLETDGVGEGAKLISAPNTAISQPDMSLSSLPSLCGAFQKFRFLSHLVYF